MRKLLLFAGILILILSGALTASRLIGGNAPPPAFAQWFTNSDGTPCEVPCLFGIRPGVTKFADVEAILDANPLTKGFSISEGYSNLPETNAKLFGWHRPVGVVGDLRVATTQGAQGVVEILDFGYPQNGDVAVTFRDNLMVFGIPQTIALSYYNNYDTNEFSYRAETIFVSIDDFHHKCEMDFTASTYHLSIYAKGYNEWFLQQLTGGDSPEEFYPWVGFGRRAYWKRYYAAEGGLQGQCTP